MEIEKVTANPSPEGTDGASFARLAKVTTTADLGTLSKTFRVGQTRIIWNRMTEIDDNLYDKFIIVDEKLITDFSMKNDRPAFAELGFTMVKHSRFLQIKDVAASHSTNTASACPFAHIVTWILYSGTQQIERNIIFKRGRTAEIDCYAIPSIIFRSLQKREVIENPCPPLFGLDDDDLTVHIGKRQVTVSASRLMVVSPVIERMLSVDMKEKQQRTLNLDGHGITMEQFMQFLEIINDHLRHGRTLPNPTNVLVLLKLADHFQIDWLKERCDVHLINCVEMPLIERFLLIEPYRLNNLKDFFLRRWNVNRLKAFMEENRERVLPPSISKEFDFQLTVRLRHKQ
uniref:BTB domain-containing protein n=1 Tax=Globodera rostochiensis TaxID=31243 RepID=A0A914GW29_GLORO